MRYTSVFKRRVLRINRVFTHIFILFLFGFLPTQLTGQYIPFQQFSVKDGLVQQQVTALYKDSRGLLWVGTKRGLSVFNEHDFTNYTDKNGLPNQYVIKIMEDAKGNIWLYTRGGWLVKFDGSTFKSYRTTENPTGVSVSLNYKTNKIYITSGKAGLFVFDLEMEKFSETISAGKHVASVGTDENGSTYFSTLEKSLYKINGDSVVKFCSFDTPVVLVENQQNHQLTGFTNDGPTNLRSVYHLEEGQMKMEFSMSRDSLKAYAILDDGTYLCQTNEEQLFVRNKGGNKRVIAEFQVGIFSFWESTKNGYVWIGGEQGLYKLFLNSFSVVKDDLVKYVWGMIEKAPDEMILLNYLTDAAIFKNSSIIPFRRLNELADDKGFYFHPVKDKNGIIYLPHQQGVYLIEDDDIRLWESPNGQAILYAYYDVGEDEVLVAGRGVVYVLKNGKLINSIIFDEAETRKHFAVSITKDTVGNYWFLTNSAVFRYSISSKEVEKFTFEQYSGYESIATDKKGRVWIGGGLGLGYWDRGADTIIRFAPHLFNFQIENLVVSDNNVLAAGGTKGIFFIDLKEWYEHQDLRIANYTRTNGYFGLEPTQNCSLIDAKNRYWVASSTDLSYIYLDSIQYTYVEPRLRIKQIGSIAIPFEDENQTIVLPYGINSFNVRFEQIGISGLWREEYFYKLHKSDGSFLDIGDSKTISFSNLASGTYHLIIKGKTLANLDVENMPTAEITFKVGIPLWKSPYFYKWAGLLFILSGVTMFLMMLRARQKKKQNEILASKNEEIKALNREIVHRSKNHLNLATYLLELQKRKSQEPDTKSALRDSENRLRALTIVNQQLSSDQSNEEIRLDTYLKELLDNLEFGMGAQLDKPLSIEFSCISELVDPNKVLRVGLIINELFTNSIKHAFADVLNPEITIDITKYNREKILLNYTDNGKGIGEEQSFSDKSQGLGLIENILKQLKGEYCIKKESGYHFKAEMTIFVPSDEK